MLFIGKKTYQRKTWIDLLEINSVTPFCVKRRIDVEVFLRRSAAYDARRLRHVVRIEGEKLVVDATDEVEGVIRSTPDHADAFLELEN